MIVYCISSCHISVHSKLLHVACICISPGELDETALLLLYLDELTMDVKHVVNAKEEVFGKAVSGEFVV